MVIQTNQYKTAKLYICFAVLLFVAKPFLGFTMFSRIHPPADKNIFVKAFTKRKQEYTENSHFNMDAIFKKLAEPVKDVFLRFSFLLNILFPFIFKTSSTFSGAFLNTIRLSRSLHGRTYLLNSNLTI